MDEYRSDAAQTQKGDGNSRNARYDLFLSYSHNDSALADYTVSRLRSASGSKCRIFQDKTELREGATWLMKVADALDQSSRVIALYSPSYWASSNCQMEFLAAFTRQVDCGQEVLFPIYLSQSSIPYMFKTLQYADCRVNDRSKLDVVCSRLAADCTSRTSNSR